MWIYAAAGMHPAHRIMQKLLESVVGVANGRRRKSCRLMKYINYEEFMRNTKVRQDSAAARELFGFEGGATTPQAMN